MRAAPPSPSFPVIRRHHGPTTPARARLTFATLAALLLAACSKPPPPAAPAPPIPVTVTPVIQQDVPIYLDSIGYATAYEAVSVQAQVDGQVLKVGFQQGAQVKKGDLLVQIDPRTYQAQLDEANGQLANDQAALSIAQLQVQRSRSLAATDLVAQQTFDTYVAQVQELQAKIQTDQGVVQEAQVNLGYCTIRSPVDGVVGFYNVNQGNVVFTKNQTVLTTIMRVEPIYLDFTVTGAQLPEVRARFLASTGALPMKAAYLNRDDPWCNATLRFLGNAVDQTTGTVMARGVYDNADTHFWPGQAIRVQLILQTLSNALLVPSACVALGQNGEFVYVKNANNTVSSRLVKTGQTEGDNVIIASGLQAGEIVVVTGQMMLKDGASVNVVAPLPGDDVAEPATPAPDAASPDAGNATAAPANTTASPAPSPPPS